jgi:hypothetical protein
MIDPHSWLAGASVDVSNVSFDDSLAAVRAVGVSNRRGHKTDP